MPGQGSCVLVVPLIGCKESKDFIKKNIFLKGILHFVAGSCAIRFVNPKYHAGFQSLSGTHLPTLNMGTWGERERQRKQAAKQNLTRPDAYNQNTQHTT